MTPEDIERVIEEVIAQNKAKLLEQRYDFSIGTLLAEVRKRLKWADGRAVKAEMDVQVRETINAARELHVRDLQLLELLGPNDRSAKSTTEKPKVRLTFTSSPYLASPFVSRHHRRRRASLLPLRTVMVIEQEPAVTERRIAACLVQENGQVRSFADLCGEALNFHKPGRCQRMERSSFHAFDAVRR